MKEIIRKREINEPLILPNGTPVIVYEAKLGAIVDFPVLVDEGQGYIQKQFQRFVRPPGTRIIAVKDTKIYLQKERRLETNNDFDWRLPGGKVVDTWNEYKMYLTTDIPEEKIIEAGKRELLEEAGLTADTISLYTKSPCGASVTWDLFYLLAEDITEQKHIHHETEEITEGKWFTFNEIKNLIREKSIQEDRTIAVLYQFMEK
jgi:8-oxo-dGTP pyrophosphatase MutT (NUDIX family)